VEIMTLCLLMAGLLKIASMAQAIRWMMRAPEPYIEWRRKNPTPSAEQWWAALESNGGRSFPFGIKDYQLRRYIALSNSSHGVRRAVGRVTLLLSLYLYRFHRLNVIAFGWAAIAIWIKAWLLWSPLTHEALLFVMTIVLLIGNVVMSAEAIVSHAVMRGYGTAFHMLPHRSKPPLLVELGTLSLALAMSIMSGAAAAYVGCIAFNALSGPALIAPPVATVSAAGGLLLQCVYWVTTTLATVGYGDIVPHNGYGQLVAFVLETQAFALVGLGVASLFASAASRSEGGT
jgi:hypothetical protein